MEALLTALEMRVPLDKPIEQDATGLDLEQYGLRPSMRSRIMSASKSRVRVIEQEKRGTTA